MESVFPPSPQWHQAHSACLCCLSADAGWLLYSLNNSIHILNPFTLKYQGILQRGHTARINALASRSILQQITRPEPNNDYDDVRSDKDTTTRSHDPPLHTPEHAEVTAHPASSEAQQGTSPLTKRPLVASGGDDSRVVCWDLTTRLPIATLTKVHQKVVRAVEWSGDGRHIISGDRGGLVVVWDPFQGKSHKKILPEKPSISCISASPTRPDVVAIGLDGGDILLCQVNMSGITVQSRLHGHTDKIQSLAWQPSVLGNREYTHLASGAADQTIRVWDVEKVISIRIMRMPDVDNKLFPHLRSRIWVPVGWTSNGQDIVSCTSRGVMIRWSLESESSHYSKISRGKVHNRNVFQIMMWPLGSFAFTFAMDRKIIAWDIDSNEGIAQIDCTGGNVYTLDVSALDPGKVAMGLGNEAIKVWNTLSDEAPYDCITIERLQSKVRTVKWHPTEEGTLCFGLENGKIGKIERVFSPAGADTSQNPNQGKRRRKGNHGQQTPQGKQQQQTQTIFQSYHEKALVSMAWCSPKVFEAPVPELFDLSLRDSTYCVISCGSDGKILVTDTSKPTNKSLDLEVVLQRQNADWYHSYKVIRGVEAVERRDVAVHPNEDLMAIGNADGSVEVFELRYFKLVYVYQGHRARVNRVKWNWSSTTAEEVTSDFETGSYLLASGSDDGAVAVHKLDQFSAPSMEERRRKERQQPVTETRSDTPDAENSEGSSALVATADASMVVPIMQAFAFFKYHTRGISDIAWSPHGSSSDSASARAQRLVTASYDGKAIVYQIQIGDVAKVNDSPVASLSTGEATSVRTGVRSHRPIACFDQHEQQVLSVHWSLSEVDIIYSGGNDWRACGWDWKAHVVTAAQLEELKRSGTNTPQSNDSKKAASAKSLASASAGNISSVAPRLGTDGVAGETSTEADSLNHDTATSLTDAGVEGAQPTATIKRKADESSAQPSSVHTKRTRTAHADTHTQPSKLATTTVGAKRVNIFPMSTAAFQVQSKQKVHLEIIRLARNLYCRRTRQGGILTTEGEHKAAKRRWRAMRQFFESDGEREGQELSRILQCDTDEMNLTDDNDDGDDDDKDEAYEKVDASDRNMVFKPFHSTNGSGQPAPRPTKPLESSSDHENDGLSVTAGDNVGEIEPSEGWHKDDSTNSIGDLVFCGSRESIKALAEMEAQEMSGLGPSPSQVNNIFTVGSGMGVPAVLAPGQRESVSSSSGTAQLGQIPISYWMGDVPKMADILSSVPATELGVQDWIGLALSPMGGVEVWKTMMAGMASKLESRGDVHAAALCYLGIGRVFEAIEVYLKLGMYREALMLLRIRLWDDYDEDDDDSEDDGSRDNTGDVGPDGSPKPTEPSQEKDAKELHIRILTEWGQQMERRGLYEQACKCQLTLASILRFKQRLRNRDALTSASRATQALQTASSVGLQTLARRGDSATLRTVAGLAILLDDPSQQQRIQQYQTAIAQKREADRNRKRLHHD